MGQDTNTPHGFTNGIPDNAQADSDNTHRVAIPFATSAGGERVVQTEAINSAHQVSARSDVLFVGVGMEYERACVSSVMMDGACNSMVVSMNTLGFSHNEAGIAALIMKQESDERPLDHAAISGPETRRLQRTYAIANLGKGAPSDVRFNPYPTAARSKRKSTLRRVGAAYGKEDLLARIAEEGEAK